MEIEIKKEAIRLFNIHYSEMNSRTLFSFNKAKKRTVVTCNIIIETFKVVCSSRQMEIEMVDLWIKIIKDVEGLTYPLATPSLGDKT